MKIGLVLSGGGSTGAYQMGVIKALEELNIKCDIVTGTSIGSINGAMYVSGALDKAEAMWNNLNFQSVFSENIKYESQKDELDVIKKYIKVATKGGIEPSNLKQNLIDSIDLDKFYNSDIDYGLTTVNFPSLKAIKLTKKEIKREELFDYIIASSTVFPVFKLKNINNKKYVDGGVRDTMPYDLAIKMGADKLIIVNTGYFFKYAKIPKKIMDKYDIKIIRPKNKTGPSLMFESIQSMKNIKYGYNDAMKTFGKLCGNKYTFKNIANTLNNNSYFVNDKQFIKTIEYLGRTFKLDDSRIYSINEYNKKLINSLERVELKQVKNIKDIKNVLNPQERIKFIHTKIANNEINNINIVKKILYKEYLAVYYLYNEKNKM